MAFSNLTFLIGVVHALNMRMEKGMTLDRVEGEALVDRFNQFVAADADASLPSEEDVVSLAVAAVAWLQVRHRDALMEQVVDAIRAGKSLDEINRFAPVHQTDTLLNLIVVFAIGVAWGLWNLQKGNVDE